MGIMLEDLNSENSQNSPQIIPFKHKKRDEGRPAMSKHEIACIFDFLDTNYQGLYGRNSSPNYVQNREDVWQDLVNAVNSVHNGIYKRTAQEINKKIDNLKTQGLYLFMYLKHK